MWFDKLTTNDNPNFKLILNKILGEQTFKGEIIWKRTNAHNKTINKLSPLTDTIWYFTKPSKFTYNRLYTNLDESYELSAYRYEDNLGKYRLGDLTGSGTRAGEWRGYNLTEHSLA